MDERNLTNDSVFAVSIPGGDKFGRRLQETFTTYDFFEQTPYAVVAVFDSNDYHCDEHYESPPVTASGPNNLPPGYPADATERLRQRNMACGVTPARFVFTTSNLDSYTDPSVSAKMQVRIACALAFFIDSDTCESVLDATGGFPRIDGCRFMSHEARLILSTPLLPGTTYSVTVKLIMPPGENSAAANNFHLTTEYYQLRVIEGTMAPIYIKETVSNAKDTETYTEPYWERGYITEFTWQPGGMDEYKSLPGVTTKFTFYIRTFGVMDNNYAIDVVAHPTNVWKFGNPDDQCEGWGTKFIATCTLKSFAGAAATEANGFQIRIGNTPADNLDNTNMFYLNLPNPLTPVNMYWTATSFRILSGSLLKTEPYTVILDKPITVLGAPIGYIANWELASITAEQWVTLEFDPSNTIIPSNSLSGILVILPPSTFTVIESAAPRGDGVQYNALPCKAWPEDDRQLGRWVCTLEDQAPFRSTLYRVQLKVRNPSTPSAARSWRIELWQKGEIQPISITRSIRGFPVSGVMSASLAPMNQLLGGLNMMLFDFVPSQDAGAMANARLQAVGPAGFVIIKRCTGFRRIQLPACECKGSDSNTFSLIFDEPDAIKGGAKYVFELEVINPVANVPEGENLWRFDTVRADGVARDTANYEGFFLFPREFVSFQVVPMSRLQGPQFVTVRFIPSERIPHDDFIRIRAPQGVVWQQPVDGPICTATSLCFESTNAATDALTLGTGIPEIIYETPNVLVVQLIDAAEANFEYGIRARCNIPLTTPVPNRWWIEQFRQTGLPSPNNWRYLASMGGEGFKTQVLVNVEITPYNIVEEAWQNPTVIQFEATMPVQPRIASTATGTEPIPAELYLEAPIGYTYICPLTPTIYMPQYAQEVPDDVICVVNHNNYAERNKLHLYFPTGIQADVRYAFTIDIVNPSDWNPAENAFKLMTRIEGEVVEQATIDGFALSKGMDNTRFLPDISPPTPPGPYDHRVEAPANVVSFILGTIIEVNSDTTLVVKAPVGFKFPYDCLSSVGEADWVPGIRVLPTITQCQNLERVSSLRVNEANLQMTGSWLLGNYALFVTVQNPVFTPPRNFWGFTIIDKEIIPPSPVMSESWVYGFEIQVVLNPTLYPYNPGNSGGGKQAINQVDVSFDLTTSILAALNQRSSIWITAPEGFYFPSVCQDFTPNTHTTDRVPLPDLTYCDGYGNRSLELTLPQMRSLLNNTRYEFRFLVVNPDETFISTDIPSKWWRIETQSSDGTWVDLNYRIPSFAIYQRLHYFKVRTLSKVGLNSTTIRIHFKTSSPLPPQQTVHIYPPPGTVFGGLRGGACLYEDEDPVLISRLFPEPLIGGVTRLPEWMSCQIVSPEELVLTNTENILGGRSLITGPVFEFFVRNVTNAEQTPELNIFRIEAMTLTPYGKEVWTADSWIIYPELTLTSVTASNPGFGLFTNFTMNMQTVSEVPERGSIRVISPADYYFGPVILTPQTRYDPLVSEPPPQGSMEERPQATEVIQCTLLRPTGWQCALEFLPCRKMYAYLEDQSIGIVLSATQIADLNEMTTRCNNMRDTCEFGDLSTLLGCQSQANILDVELAPDVVLPARRIFQFLIQGYNARTAPVNSDSNTWHFMTRNSDSQKTVLDEKPGIPGFSLIGIVFVESIVPSDTKVDSIENYVTVTIRLATACQPRALLRITHPMEFSRNANAAFQGSAIETGSNFPRQVEKRQTLNVIELEAIEETLPAGIPLEITIGLSNPDISPMRQNNIWMFEAFSMATGTVEKLNCNYNVTGFKIFGEFSAAHVTGKVLSPMANNIIGIWFILKSPLPYSPTSQMKIWLPRGGFLPLENCGGVDFKLEYNAYTEGVRNPFPAETNFFPLPSGTECYDRYDEDSDQYYILLKVDARLDYGLDYAFEFGISNPAETPPAEENVWRFETLQNGVILHLQRNIPGFELEQINTVEIFPSDTTNLLPFNRIEFYMMSEKAIQGGSKIIITAPEGFVFTCQLFRTDSGLSSTTTCLRTLPNRVELQIDSQDPKPPESPFRLYIYVANPEFTPQNNYWNFVIVSPLEVTIDSRDHVPGFFITGQLQVDIHPGFPYFGQTDPLHVVFVQSTIMNQADDGNELVLTAPTGYIFPANCTDYFRLRLTNTRDSISESGGYPSTFTFPPAGVTCTGYGNSSVTIRLPNGHGLLRNNYTIEIEVENPAYVPEGSNTWTFITRVRNDLIGERIVDANRNLPGFTLRELVPVRTDEGAAPSQFVLCNHLLFLTVFTLHVAVWKS